MAAVLYARGMVRSASRTPALRLAAFFAGLALIYAALQTSCNYYASHMFSVLQLQHFALHDLAPALLAWAAPGAALAEGAASAAARSPARAGRGPARDAAAAARCARGNAALCCQLHHMALAAGYFRRDGQ
ncbi:MAG: cytochrome c oxidase assembly protein [Steroidobacteraceae bacterium]